MENNSKRDRLAELKYHLIPGKTHPAFHAIDLHNQAYEYWKKFWSEIYTSAGSPEAFNLDDFSRQDFIAVLTHQEIIIGLHLYTLFNLEQQSNREHRYFKFYPPEFFDYLKNNDASWAMSLEFLTVDPAWRKSVCDVSLGEVLLGCGICLLDALGVDAAIAPARADNKANRMAYNFHFDCFQAGVRRRNFEVDLVAGFRNRLRKHPDPRINALISQFWNDRVDHTRATNSAPMPMKSAV